MHKRNGKAQRAVRDKMPTLVHRITVSVGKKRGIQRNTVHPIAIPVPVRKRRDNQRTHRKEKKTPTSKSSQTNQKEDPRKERTETPHRIALPSASGVSAYEHCVREPKRVLVSPLTSVQECSVFLSAVRILLPCFTSAHYFKRFAKDSIMRIGARSEKTLSLIHI